MAKSCLSKSEHFHFPKVQRIFKGRVLQVLQFWSHLFKILKKFMLEYSMAVIQGYYFWLTSVVIIRDC
jgi:hypothetical protein